MTAAHPTSSQADPPLSRAGSLPQWTCASRKTEGRPISNVGAGLLAMAAAHPTTSQADPTLSRAGSLPQWTCASRKTEGRPRSNVGAGLLAMAPAHPTTSQADPPLSRASSLPQGTCASRKTEGRPRSNVGASLLAMTAAHPTSSQADPPLSRASSHSGPAPAAKSKSVPDQMWERACSRRRRHIQHHRKQTHRFREQARSHRGVGVDGKLAAKKSPQCERAKGVTGEAGVRAWLNLRARRRWPGQHPGSSPAHPGRG